MATYHSFPTVSKPIQEVLLSKAGTLLVACEPRYEDLQSYIVQMGAPLSMLRGVGLWTFQDALAPDLTILVCCEEVDYCPRCERDLRRCSCAF